MNGKSQLFSLWMTCFISCCYVTHVHCFTVTSSSLDRHPSSLATIDLYHTNQSHHNYLQPSLASKQRTSTTSTFSTCLHVTKNKKQSEPQNPPSSDLLDGYEKRGLVLFALVAITNIWSFTIPVELRRAHICSTQKCVEDNTGRLCYDCISWGEWKERVVDYYKGGGGIHFDFSVEEK